MKTAWNNIREMLDMKMFLRVFMIILSVCMLSACEDETPECDIGSIQAAAKECWSCPVFEKFSRRRRRYIIASNQRRHRRHIPLLR